jgi:hypothetical protein
MRPSGKSHLVDYRVFLFICGIIAQACDSTTLVPSGEKMLAPSFLVLGNGFSAWSTPVNVVTLNTAQTDGCPFISPDGKTLFMASNRDGSQGLDIYVSTRSNEDEPWGPPAKVTSVNSAFDDFCPTMSRDGKLLYFVSRRPSTCGQGDIYVARLRADHGFDAPEVLPCDSQAPYEAVNSPFDEFSPFPQLDPGAGPMLYFSSFRPGGFAADVGPPDSDLYWSRSHNGVFSSTSLIPGVNSAQDDGQPNVGSDGLELFFYSTRQPGSQAADLYVATRQHPLGSWTSPLNLGTTVNSTAAETRPSLSWDGLHLYFGSTRGGGSGMTDIYVTTRQRLVKEND